MQTTTPTAPRNTTQSRVPSGCDTSSGTAGQDASTNRAADTTRVLEPAKLQRGQRDQPAVGSRLSADAVFGGEDMRGRSAPVLILLAERDGIAFWIRNGRDPLSPGHVLRGAQDSHARVIELPHQLIQVRDVDVHLESGTIALGETVAIHRPLSVDYGKLRRPRVAPQPDVPGLTLSGKLDVSLEAQQLPEMRLLINL